VSIHWTYTCEDCKEQSESFNHADKSMRMILENIEILAPVVALSERMRESGFLEHPLFVGFGARVDESRRALDFVCSHWNRGHTVQLKNEYGDVALSMTAAMREEESIVGFVQRRTAEEREKIAKRETWSARAAAGFDAWRSALTDRDVENILISTWADGSDPLVRSRGTRLGRPDRIEINEDAYTASRETEIRWTDLDVSESASSFITDDTMGVKEVAERVGALLGVDLLPTSSFVLTVDAVSQSVTLSRTEDLEYMRLHIKGEL
jgi:hypothetical protein